MNAAAGGCLQADDMIISVLGSRVRGLEPGSECVVSSTKTAQDSLGAGQVTVLSKLAASLTAIQAFKKWEVNPTVQYALCSLSQPAATNVITQLVHLAAFEGSTAALEVANFDSDANDALARLCSQGYVTAGPSRCGSTPWRLTRFGARSVVIEQTLANPSKVLEPRPVPVALQSPYELLLHMQERGWQAIKKPAKAAQQLCYERGQALVFYAASDSACKQYLLALLHASEHDGCKVQHGMQHKFYIRLLKRLKKEGVRPPDFAQMDDDLEIDFAPAAAALDNLDAHEHFGGGSELHSVASASTENSDEEEMPGIEQSQDESLEQAAQYNPSRDEDQELIDALQFELFAEQGGDAAEAEGPEAADAPVSERDEDGEDPDAGYVSPIREAGELDPIGQQPDLLQAEACGADHDDIHRDRRGGRGERDTMWAEGFWGPFRITWKVPQDEQHPNNSRHGSLQAECPFHKKNEKSACRKLLACTGPDRVHQEFALLRLKTWCVKAKEFAKQAQHVKSHPLMPDVNEVQHLTALIEAQKITDGPANGSVMTDDAIEEADRKEAQKEARAAKKRLEPTATAVAVASGSATPDAPAVKPRTVHSKDTPSSSSTAGPSAKRAGKVKAKPAPLQAKTKAQAKAKAKESASVRNTSSPGKSSSNSTSDSGSSSGDDSGDSSSSSSSSS